MIWLLDTGPLILLAAKFNFDEERQWPADTLHVTTHVVEETRENPYVKRLLACASPQGSWVRCHEISARSRAGQRLAELRRDAAGAQKDLGEDASLALALTDLTESILVTDDNRCVFMAVQELGPGRVSTSFDLWLSLLQTSCISLAVARTLCDATRRKLNNRTMPTRIAHILDSWVEP